ncbi:MAG: hypothetical protein RSB76_02755, partial [Clostridia bacterium]
MLNENLDLKIHANNEEIAKLLLHTISLEQEELSKIIKLESNNLTYFVSQNNTISLKDILNINESIDKVLNDVKNIEILLNEKIKNICNIYDKKVILNNDIKQNNKFNYN